jgi:hypothetical protein
MAAEDSGGTNGFPVYRRMVGSAHYYRIDAPDAFTELQRIGKRLVRHEVAAAQYPERVRIREMMDCAEGRYAPMEAREWEALLAEG